MQNPVNTQANQNTQNIKIIPTNPSKNMHPGYNTQSAQQRAALIAHNCRNGNPQ